MPRKAKNSKAKVNHAKRTARPIYVPTEEEILKECQAIQAGWSVTDEKNRRGIKVKDEEEWMPPPAISHAGVYESRPFLSQLEEEE